MILDKFINKLLVTIKKISEFIKVKLLIKIK